MPSKAKSFSNEYLIYTINKLRKENKYGNYGTGYHVSSHEFHRGNISSIKKELARRQKKGTISKTAGKPRKNNNLFNVNFNW